VGLLDWLGLGGRPPEGAEAGAGDADPTRVPAGFAALAELGVPLEAGASDPKAAFAGGFVKSTLVRALGHLDAGRPDDALAAAEIAIKRAHGLPALQAASAAGFYIRGRAHQAKGEPLAARVDFEAAIAASAPGSQARKRYEEELRALG